jgi:hypothetical protein
VVQATPAGGGASKSATTRSDGTYRIANLQPGRYHVSATYFGQTRTLTDLLVEASMDLPRVNVRLPGVGSISGKVTDANTGAALPKVKVRAYDSHNVQVAETKTDRRGRYSLSDLPEGTYKLKFSKGGYGGEIVKNVVVTAGQDTKVDKGLYPQ